MPDEIYNLAAQSHVGYSFKAPITTLDMTGKGVLYLLEIIREINPKIRFYQASTSELFGGDPGTEPQNEDTPFNPHSPYAIAKLAGFHYVKLYREAYGMFACNGILFNHESPRRGEDFVTRKITVAVARIKAGKQDHLELGNMDAKRDWGFAGDYVEGMWMMMQQDKPDDYVLSTGETHTVREFVEESFRVAGHEIAWEGKDENEIGKDKKTGKILVKINPEFFRPGEVPLLLGDNTKAQKVLKWKPKVTYAELAEMMVRDDLEKVEKGLL
jgi:GDPmannose 4,6-dehydratase